MTRVFDAFCIHLGHSCPLRLHSAEYSTLNEKKARFTGWQEGKGWKQKKSLDFIPFQRQWSHFKVYSDSSYHVDAAGHWPVFRRRPFKTFGTSPDIDSASFLERCHFIIFDVPRHRWRNHAPLQCRTVCRAKHLFVLLAREYLEKRWILTRYSPEDASSRRCDRKRNWKKQTQTSVWLKIRFHVQ